MCKHHSHTHNIQSVAEPAKQLSFWQGLRQSFSLMVGVKDYDTYLRQLTLHHPEAKPMTRKEFYLFCVNDRFPSDGKIGRCPC